MRLVTTLLLLVGIVTAAPAAAETLTLQGSTTLSNRLMIPQQHAIEARAGHKLIIVPNKSSLGLQALFEGGAQFGMISGPLETEIKTLRRIVPQAPFERLKAFEIGRTRMAFAVHPDNPVRSISKANLRHILLGEFRNWREVGGHDLPIRLVIVREGGGVQASVETDVLDGAKIVAPDPIRVQISSQVVKIVLQEPGALGLAQYGVLKKANAPEMKVDEPVEQRLSFVSLGDPSPAMLDVIEAAREVASKTLQ